MIDRPTALALMESRIKNKNLRKHILAVEAIMIKLAGHFGEDANIWGLTGLLHDLDYAVTLKKPEKHTFTTAQWLAEFKLPDEMIYAIRCHPGHTPCLSKMDWALFCSDPTSGFIAACALMHPSRKLINVDAEFMMRRFKEKRFAAGASREGIASCSQLGLELEDYLMLGREAMLTILDKLEL
ncbi:MAG: HDIG domain-containing metalloprotein [Candidatus Zixiibacteriota bacterium]